MNTLLPRELLLKDGTGILVRLITQDDSIAELTRLLHRAYRPLAEQGMRFYASHQDEATTRERIAHRWCLVAFEGEELVGTVTLSRPGQVRGHPWYEQPHVALFGQLAVHPRLQRRGLGSALLDLLELLAKADGATELALDTAETAHQLIDYYTRRGHRLIGYAQWQVTNYRSVVLSKTLG